MEAAKFVLHGSSNVPTADIPSTSATTSATTTKQEEFAVVIEKLTQVLAAVISNQSAPQSSIASASTAPRSLPMRPPGCFGCGAEDHMGRDCPHLKRLEECGKCRRNHEGKFVLSSGAFVPRSIPGNNMVERIEEWHKRNPGQIAMGSLSSNANTSASGMMLSITPRTLEPTQPTSAFVHTISPAQAAFDKIEDLERQLMELHARPVFDGVDVPRILKKPAQSSIKAAQPPAMNKQAMTPIAPAMIPNPAPVPIPTSTITAPSLSPSTASIPAASTSQATTVPTELTIH